VIQKLVTKCKIVSDLGVTVGDTKKNRVVLFLPIVQPVFTAAVDLVAEIFI
jgi:hypothetical protein